MNLSAIIAARHRATAAGFSTEAQSYFDRLDTAGDTTYTTYKQPLANYIDGLVTLGGAYWDTMLSATSFVGVGIEGVVVPLRDGMTVPTNNNFVAGDLNQLTGLKGNLSNKRLNTNVADTSASQNDVSASAHITEKGTAAFDCLYGSSETGGSVKIVTLGSNTVGISINDFAGTNVAYPTTGMLGASRTGTNSISYISDGTVTTGTASSGVPQGGNLFIFATNNGGSAIRNINARLATYHYGPALNLATLGALQDTLISEIAAI